tara:strand:- start:75 stop:269 length:195 start_codon:yes stop_codon:yes gene_type:complete
LALLPVGQELEKYITTTMQKGKVRFRVAPQISQQRRESLLSALRVDRHERPLVDIGGLCGERPQ